MELHLRLPKWFRRFGFSECGQGLVEYSLIVAAVSVGLIAVLLVLRNSTGNVYNGAQTGVDQAIACSQGSSAACAAVGGSSGTGGGSTGGGSTGGGSNGGGNNGGGNGQGNNGNGNGKGGGNGSNGGGNGQGNNGNGNGNGGGNGSNGQGGGKGNKP
ncbi:MAG TPA: hypothetical protein VMY76_12845 [Gemmatimonadales bacterium]|nr:hypothetical protein [Gemmatimonadales bacterium]